MFALAPHAFEKCNVLYGDGFAAEEIVPLDPFDGVRPLVREKMSKGDGGLEAALCWWAASTAKGAFDLGLQRIQLAGAFDPDQEAVRRETFANVSLSEGNFERLPGEAGEGEVDFFQPVPISDLSNEAEGDVMVFGRNPLHAGHRTAHQRKRFPDIGRKVECDKKSQEARFP